MSFAARSKDNPGDVGRAADQQQSVDNEDALFDAVLGPGAVPTGGIVKQWVQLTGLVDNTATEVFTITTTDEAGNNDGGVYYCEITGIATHGIGPTGDTSVAGYKIAFARAMRSTGAGQVSAIGPYTGGAMIAESEGGTTKGLVTPVLTVVETSEFVMSVRFAVNIDGTTITTANVYGMVTLYYAGFTTPPAVTSVG